MYRLSGAELCKPSNSSNHTFNDAKEPEDIPKEFHVSVSRRNNPVSLQASRTRSLRDGNQSLRKPSDTSWTVGDCDKFKFRFGHDLEVCGQLEAVSNKGLQDNEVMAYRKDDLRSPTLTDANRMGRMEGRMKSTTPRRS